MLWFRAGDVSRTEFCSREHTHDQGTQPRAEGATGTSHGCPRCETAGKPRRGGPGTVYQPTRFGLPDSQPASAYHKHWWKGSDSHGRSAKVCSWRSSWRHHVLNAYAFWSDPAICLAINLVTGCKRSGRFAIYTMNSSLHLFSLGYSFCGAFDAASS
jgi:hypothetical protein